MTCPAVWGPSANSSRHERSSCTEGSVAEVGARPTDEKRTSVRRALQSSWVGVGDEAAVVSQSGAQTIEARPYALSNIHPRQRYCAVFAKTVSVVNLLLTCLIAKHVSHAACGKLLANSSFLAQLNIAWPAHRPASCIHVEQGTVKNASI